jgi:hypothetical protein
MRDDRWREAVALAGSDGHRQRQTLSQAARSREHGVNVTAPVAFRESPAFQQWRAIAGPHFVAPPEVVHTARAIGRSFERAGPA